MSVITDPIGPRSGAPTQTLDVQPYQPPGTPRAPTGNQSGDQQVENGNGQLPKGNSSGAPKPKPVKMFEVKEKLLRPALTSNFQCWFNPPQAVRQYYDAELISLLCSEASLPGSSLITNEINDDHTGVTERFAYRKQYDDRADFTFYVDYGRQNGSYNLILFFEEWMRYAVNESSTAENHNYFYRANFPDGSTGYRSEAIYVNKFERDFKGDYLEYKFLKAYPISVTSMPVSYDSSELLKCSVSFSYTRYVLRKQQHSIEQEARQSTIAELEQSRQERERQLIPNQIIGGGDIVLPGSSPNSIIQKSQALSQQQIRNRRLGL